MTPRAKTQEKKGTAAKQITPKQAEFLALIRLLIKRDSVSPTLAELAEAHGVSKPTAAAYVRRLRAGGFLVDSKGKYRAIRPVAPTPKGAASQLA